MMVKVKDRVHPPPTFITFTLFSLYFYRNHRLLLKQILVKVFQSIDIDNENTLRYCTAEYSAIQYGYIVLCQDRNSAILTRQDIYELQT